MKEGLDCIEIISPHHDMQRRVTIASCAIEHYWSIAEVFWK